MNILRKRYSAIDFGFGANFRLCLNKKYVQSEVCIDVYPNSIICNALSGWNDSSGNLHPLGLKDMVGEEFFAELHYSKNGWIGECTADEIIELGHVRLVGCKIVNEHRDDSMPEYQFTFHVSGLKSYKTLFQAWMELPRTNKST